MHILIGADLVPTESNRALFESGNVTALLGAELSALLRAATYRVFNLEIPLTDEKDPIKKCGPNLIAPTSVVAGCRAMGIDLLTLANNHIMDQGIRGLESTCRVLNENEIAYLGVGETIKQAASPYLITLGDKRIGIYACTEHESSVATQWNAGANPFDPLESPDHVKALKDRCDYVIVLYHGGKEHYQYPSPDLQKTCRKLVEKGADLVLCQHSHCIGCEEKYRHGTIVYGQGNFIFDRDVRMESWNTSLLVKLDEDLSLHYIPLVRTKETIRLAQGQQAEEILQNFRQRSLEIRDPNVLREKYEKFADSLLDQYLWEISGARSFLLLRVLNKLSGGRFRKKYVQRRYGSTRRLHLINFMECEAHREMLLEALKK